MKTIITSVFLLLATGFANGQSIYTKTFGSPQAKPIIFLHGGPGYNCANFEATTAQQLADIGFYVIIYDRRGEGRSKDPNAQFTFQETFDDLNAVYRQYGLMKSTLIGHSFGGVVATLFAEKYPKKIQTIILVGAPVSFQETLKTIISTSKTIYQTKNDSINLNYIAMLENMDKNSLEYSSYSLIHAMQNGFYSPKNPTEEAKIIYTKFKSDSLSTKYASQTDYRATQGFWKNEKYTTINLTTNLKKLQANNIKIYGLYGKDDGLYTADQVKEIQNLLGENNVKYLDNCSHYVFVDQQSQFIDTVEMWTKCKITGSENWRERRYEWHERDALTLVLSFKRLCNQKIFIPLQLQLKLIKTKMKTKETKEAPKSVSKEETGKPKKLNALGEWINSPDWKPFIKIIDMKAVMRLSITTSTICQNMLL